jgi:hypothetical protein
VAQPLRFRRSDERWTADRVRSLLTDDLDRNLGATALRPWYRQPAGYDARRFEMDDGSRALFAWPADGGGGTGGGDGRHAYWMGNTETPEALWGTDKYSFAEVPDAVAEWAGRELLAELHEDEPWLVDYPAVSWFFLPVLCSKDGGGSTRAFFRDRAAGFPDADRDAALGFYESFLATGALDAHRHVMAGKLGTSEAVDSVRMRAAMSEFTAAKLLHEAGYDLTPESEVTTGHAIDFRVDRGGEEPQLVEVTRPLPPDERSAGTAPAAIRETAATKTDGQLEHNGGGVTLFVDCTSFPDDAWAAVLDARPSVGHRPAVVFRVRPGAPVEGYTLGSVPVDCPPGIDTG